MRNWMGEGRDRRSMNEKIPEWLLKKMREGTMSAEEYGQILDRKVESGELTPAEAEDEYQDYLHRDEVWREW